MNFNNNTGERAPSSAGYSQPGPTASQLSPSIPSHETIQPSAMHQSMSQTHMGPIGQVSTHQTQSTHQSHATNHQNHTSPHSNHQIHPSNHQTHTSPHQPHSSDHQPHSSTHQTQIVNQLNPSVHHQHNPILGQQNQLSGVHNQSPTPTGPPTDPTSPVDGLDGSFNGGYHSIHLMLGLSTDLMLAPFNGSHYTETGQSNRTTEPTGQLSTRPTQQSPVKVSTTVRTVSTKHALKEPYDEPASTDQTRTFGSPGPITDRNQMFMRNSSDYGNSLEQPSSSEITTINSASINTINNANTVNSTSINSSTSAVKRKLDSDASASTESANTSDNSG